MIESIELAWATVPFVDTLYGRQFHRMDFNFDGIV